MTDTMPGIEFLRPFLITSVRFRRARPAWIGGAAAAGGNFWRLSRMGVRAMPRLES